jgi:hypothetical protein
MDAINLYKANYTQNTELGGVLSIVSLFNPSTYPITGALFLGRWSNPNTMFIPS